MTRKLLQEILNHDADLRQVWDVMVREWQSDGCWSEWDQKIYSDHLQLIQRIREHVASKKFRIGFDLHGVLENCPDDFMPLLKEFRKEGFEIWVISGPPIIRIRQELEKLHYTPLYDYFDRFESVVDFLKRDPTLTFTQNEKGDWSTDDCTWWSSKGRICEDNSIDVLIDDSIQYKEHFSSSCTTEFILLNDSLCLGELKRRIFKKRSRLI